MCLAESARKVDFWAQMTESRERVVSTLRNPQETDMSGVGTMLSRQRKVGELDTGTSNTWRWDAHPPTYSAVSNNDTNPPMYMCSAVHCVLCSVQQQRRHPRGWPRIRTMDSKECCAENGSFVFVKLILRGLAMLGLWHHILISTKVGIYVEGRGK